MFADTVLVVLSAIFLKKSVPERNSDQKHGRRGVSFSFRIWPEYTSLFERREIGQQETPNLVKPIQGKRKFPERRSG
jgi:hypothetical protein